MGGGSASTTSQATTTKNKTITDSYNKTKNVNKDSHDVTTKNTLKVKLGKKARIYGTDALGVLGGTSAANAAASAPASVIAAMPASVSGQAVGDAAIGLGIGDSLKYGAIGLLVLIGIAAAWFLLRKR